MRLVTLPAHPVGGPAATGRGRSLAAVTHSPDPDVEVPHPIMRMGWEQLTFIHWAYSPDELQRLLPPGLAPHLFEDQAWVSLVPFVMRVGFPGVGVIPW